MSSAKEKNDAKEKNGNVFRNVLRILRASRDDSVLGVLPVDTIIMPCSSATRLSTATKDPKANPLKNLALFSLTWASAPPDGYSCSR
jgi:hypothetical protein